MTGLSHHTEKGKMFMEGGCGQLQGLFLTVWVPPCVTFRLVVVLLRGPGQSPVLPFACCVGLLLSVGRCGRCSCWCRFRVCGARSWCVEAALNVAWCAVCVSAAPNSWRIEDVPPTPPPIHANYPLLS